VRAIRLMSQAAKALTGGAVDAALPIERNALTALQRAFSKNRLILRALTKREQLDMTRRAGGRGGYLHRSRECWDRFAGRKGMLRSLRATIDRPARAALIAELQPDAGE